VRDSSPPARSAAIVIPGIRAIALRQSRANGQIPKANSIGTTPPPKRGQGGNGSKWKEKALKTLHCRLPRHANGNHRGNGAFTRQPSEKD
jgi:hypothetical protein